MSVNIAPSINSAVIVHLRSFSEITALMTDSRIVRRLPLGDSFDYSGKWIEVRSISVSQERIPRLRGSVQIMVLADEFHDAEILYETVVGVLIPSDRKRSTWPVTLTGGIVTLGIYGVESMASDYYPLTTGEQKPMYAGTFEMSISEYHR